MSDKPENHTSIRFWLKKTRFWITFFDLNWRSTLRQAQNSNFDHTFQDLWSKSGAGATTFENLARRIMAPKLPQQARRRQTSIQQENKLRFNMKAKDKNIKKHCVCACARVRTRCAQIFRIRNIIQPQKANPNEYTWKIIYFWYKLILKWPIIRRKLMGAARARKDSWHKKQCNHRSQPEWVYVIFDAKRL